jgi:hypothetical protein
MNIPKGFSHQLTDGAFDCPDGPDNLALDEHQNMKYATLAKIVIRMTFASEMNLVHSFLLTYRSFTLGGKEFLQALQARCVGLFIQIHSSIMLIFQRK